MSILNRSTLFSVMSVEVADIKSKVDDPRPKTKAQLKAERRAKQGTFHAIIAMIQK